MKSSRCLTRVTLEFKVLELNLNWMWDHFHGIHGGPMDLENDYAFQVLSSHRDPLTRQTTEAIRIQKALQQGIHISRNGEPVQIISLNRKGEHFAPMERWNYDK